MGVPIADIGAGMFAAFAVTSALYAREQWLPLRYTDAQIRSDPGYSHRTVSGRR